MSQTIAWLREKDLVLLLAVLVVVLGVWGFLALADEVTEGETQKLDNRILLALRDPADLARPIGPRWVNESARDMTALGGFTVLPLMIAAVAGYLAITRKYQAMCLVLGATVSGLLVSLLLKHSFDRPRPTVVPPLAGDYTSSFPSGHSLMSAVVYLTLGSLLARVVQQKRLKNYFVAVAMLLTLLVGLSRVYLGVHYPTDVLAGWTAGLVWAVLWWLAARFLQQRGLVEDQAPHEPEA
jgi:undecaprenyl-diphosphatase